MAATNASSQKCIRSQARPDGSSGVQPPQGIEEAQAAALTEKIARLEAALNPKMKKVHAGTVSQAKNYLRATKTRAPRFLRSTPAPERHSRKCAICHHPEREAIEDLFIHWHSPQDISEFFYKDETITWVSIYRHAYALGLDAIRRRNLGFVFERILDNAADAQPTSAGVVAAARALGCVGENGRWTEPPKRILMTTIVRKEDPSAVTSTDLDAPASASEELPQFPSSLPPARRGGEAVLNEPAAATRRPSPDYPSVARSGTREINFPPNSRKIKDKPISNR
ncbi:MAG TPA: hypothetical protein VGT03_15500 [Candidatus Acidoferrales bacterium]|nr:hypothetical protein [Candidatus Acidoferrales bacterium]